MVDIQLFGLGQKAAESLPGSVQGVIASSAHTDLGSAPVEIEALGSPVAIVVADTKPADGTVHFVLPTGRPTVFYKADASSHVFVATFGGLPSVVTYSAIISLAA